jgi:hypothetical protein
MIGVAPDAAAPSGFVAFLVVALVKLTRASGSAVGLLFSGELSPSFTRFGVGSSSPKKKKTRHKKPVSTHLCIEEQVIPARAVVASNSKHNSTTGPSGRIVRVSAQPQQKTFFFLWLKLRQVLFV